MSTFDKMLTFSVFSIFKQISIFAKDYHNPEYLFLQISKLIFVHIYFFGHRFFANFFKSKMSTLCQH